MTCRFFRAAACAALAAAALAGLAGCITRGDNCVGLAGWTADPTNKVVVSRWVFPVYQWQRASGGSRATKTYILAGLAGWRSDSAGDLAETWLHPVWYRDSRSLESRTAGTVRRTTAVSVFPFVTVQNVREQRIEDPWDAHPISETSETRVFPGFTYVRKGDAPADVKWLWGMFKYQVP